jgi:predicted nucleotidyltransferase
MAIATDNRLIQEIIREYAQRLVQNHIPVWRIYLFGSHVKGLARPDSDIDFLVTCREGQKPEWPRILDMQDELSASMGRPVDSIDRKNVEQGETETYPANRTGDGGLYKRFFRVRELLMDKSI